MFYCVTDNLEGKISFVSMYLNRCHFAVIRHTHHNISGMLKYSTSSSARVLTTVVVMLREPNWFEVSQAHQIKRRTVEF